MAVVYEGLRLPVLEEMSLEMRTIMNDCWNVDPAERPSFKGIFNSGLAATNLVLYF